MGRLHTALHRATILLSVVACLSFTPTASAAQTVKLKASLTPERLGAETTIAFSFQVSASRTLIPSPLTALDLSYPADISLGTTGLGLESCNPTRLERLGASGCPANSLMGYGTATVELQIGPNIIHESTRVTTWMAPIQNEHFQLLFYADGESPVEAQLVLPSTLLDAPSPFGGKLDTFIPVVPSIPEAPDVAVTAMHSTIGAMNITYYRRGHGKTVAYHPHGLLLPKTCPKHGFPFAAAFAFLDGTHADAHASVPCPRP